MNKFNKSYEAEQALGRLEDLRRALRAVINNGDILGDSCLRMALPIVHDRMQELEREIGEPNTDSLDDPRRGLAQELNRKGII